MTHMGKRNIFTMGMALIFVFLIALAGAGGVGAAPPTDGPPGQGDCDHGNSQQSCRPDPQPSNGKDCDEHGNNGGVNEDHCSGAPEVTPSPTPTATPSESATPSSSAEPSSTPSPTNSATPSAPPTGQPSPSGEPSMSSSATVPSVTVTPPPTDTEATSSVALGGNLFYVIAGIVAAVTAASLLTPRRKQRR